MTTITHTGPTPRGRFARSALTAAAVAVTIAIAAAATTAVVDPAAGSTLERVLGLTAATAGLSTGALIAAAAIHTSVTGGWDRLPRRARHLTWAVLAVVVARTLWSQISALV